MAKPFDPELTPDELSIYFPNLSSFEIIKSGGEGTVFKAQNTENIELAVKVYGTDHLHARTELEVKKLLNISNDNMAKLYDHGNIIIRNTECYFTETSYIDGYDLRELLEKGYHFSENDVKTMISCITSCINDLWQQKVVHCDIKPENIIKSGNKYYLIDLGIAKHLDAETLTMVGTIMGTLGYLAPEQFNGRKNLTLKADFFALGITAFEILTGKHPYNKNQRLMMSNPEYISFPNNLNVSDNLKKLILKLIEPYPFNRPLNQSEILSYIQ